MLDCHRFFPLFIDEENFVQPEVTGRSPQMEEKMVDEDEVLKMVEGEREEMV